MGSMRGHGKQRSKECHGKALLKSMCWDVAQCETACLPSISPEFSQPPAPV